MRQTYVCVCVCFCEVKVGEAARPSVYLEESCGQR